MEESVDGLGLLTLSVSPLNRERWLGGMLATCLPLAMQAGEISSSACMYGGHVK